MFGKLGARVQNLFATGCETGVYLRDVSICWIYYATGDLLAHRRRGIRYGESPHGDCDVTHAGRRPPINTPYSTSLHGTP